MTEASATELTGAPDEIGRQVVCIDARGGGLNDPKIVEGDTYTIEGFDAETDELGVWLLGIPNTRHPEWENPLSWRATRFRLITEHSVRGPS